MFFDQWHLSPSQFNILNLLYQEPAGISQVQLSRELVMHRSNMTGLINRLEERGFVVRRSNPGDKRAYAIVLTASGKRLIEQVLPHFYDAAERVWGDLPARRANELIEELKRLSATAEQLARNPS